MTTQRPIHQVRIGRIVASIWQNETDTGSRHVVRLTRIYKTDPQSEWKRTESFGRDDLPTLEKVCDAAFRWIHDHRSKDSEERVA